MSLPETRYDWFAFRHYALAAAVTSVRMRETSASMRFDWSSRSMNGFSVAFSQFKRLR